MQTLIKSVPLLDLHREYAPIRTEVLKAIEEVVDSTQFIMGPKITELEKKIATYCDAKRAVGVSSGTDALVIALMALEIGQDDEVITTPFTFFATAGSIARVGAKAVFVDIDPLTYNIDPAKIEAAITPKTKAIMPVHLFGQMADMDPIMDIAKRHNLFVIEDAAQAIGSTYKGKKAGSVGTIGCFSFFPSKNLGCCGDGGIVTTNDEALADKLEILRVHGSKPKYYHHLIGGNFRLDPLQAAVLLVKLPFLEGHHAVRRQNAAFFDASFKGILDTPYVQEGNGMIYNQYTLRLKNRVAMINALDAKNIGHSIYYPVPLHMQSCFEHWGYKAGDFPESEKAATEVLSIPIFSGLTQEELETVVRVITNHKN
ncbi:MAG: DegT/DnrJ/EryC1/StrS family aminotransferase [Candidatus Margulisbacteria bacterium]|nr:DegT/DnrJ/EryC1/StrS family aminotransferase [Candidatus Margulisiibacteriota bacterium]